MFRCRSSLSLTIVGGFGVTGVLTFKFSPEVKDLSAFGVREACLVNELSVSTGPGIVGEILVVGLLGVVTPVPLGSSVTPPAGVTAEILDVVVVLAGISAGGFPLGEDADALLVSVLVFSDVAGSKQITLTTYFTLQ